jgi:hypothetical protein
LWHGSLSANLGGFFYLEACLQSLVPQNGARVGLDDFLVLLFVTSAIWLAWEKKPYIIFLSFVLFW